MLAETKSIRIFFVVAILLSSGSATAEPPLTMMPTDSSVSLKGYTRQRVIAEMGQPDDSSDSSLTYGRAKIFFQDDKVIGISGADELSKRATLNSNIESSRRTPSRRDDLRGEWNTPWSSR